MTNPSRRLPTRLAAAVVEPVWLEAAAAIPAAAAATVVVVVAAAAAVAVVVVAAATVVVVVAAAAGAAVAIVVAAAAGVVVVVLVAEAQWGGGRTEGETKTNHNEGCGSFSGRTAWALPLPGSPLRVSPSPNTSIEQQPATHIPMERGGADLDSPFCTWALLVGDPSMEGRASHPRRCVSFGANGDGEGEWWWWRKERGRTKINRDGVDGGFKLHSSS